MYTKAVSEIFFGKEQDIEDEFEVNEENIQSILRMFGSYLDLFALATEDGEQPSENEEDEEDDESEENVVAGTQQLQIAEPAEREFSDTQKLTEFLQQNPGSRTFLRAIAQAEGLLDQSGYNTRNAQPGRQRLYNVYALSDLRIAPTAHVRRIFKRIVDDKIHKHSRRVNRFGREYFASLLDSLQLLSQSQLESTFNQGNASEQMEQQLRQKKSEKELEKDLAKFVRLQNETKENFFIVAQERKQFNYYEHLLESNQNFRNPLDSADFYRDLERIIKKRKVILPEDQEKYPVEIDTEGRDQEELNQEEAMRKLNNEAIGQFFKGDCGSGVQLWGQMKSGTFSQAHRPFSFESEANQPGFALFGKIKQQLEADRKYNEQMKEKGEGDDQRKSKTVASRVDGTATGEAKKEKVVMTKMEEEFQRQVDGYSYFNEEVAQFCLGRKDHFLARPFASLNRIEVDLSDPAFFSEKLSQVLHLQKTQAPVNVPRVFREHFSILSRPNDQTSLLSQNNRADLASKNPNESGSEGSERSEPFFENESSDSQAMQGDNQLRHEIQILIQSHQKKKVQTGILNSPVAESFELNNFSQRAEDHGEYHRSNFMNLYLRSEFRGDVWRATAVKAAPRTQVIAGQSKFDVVPEQLNCQEQFKTVDSLSLAKSKYNFVLFEFVEQRPLVMNNPGMRTKIQRYVYESRARKTFFNSKDSMITEDINDGIAKFKNMIIDRLGKFGQIQFLQHETLPLQGQVVDENIIGVAIMENDLFRAPIFQQKLPETDFLLVRKANIDAFGNKTYEYKIRMVDHIYLVGQIEPKMEIYTPHSRSLGTFSKNCLKTYIKQRFQQDGGKVLFSDLQEVFYRQSEQNIRNALKECSATQDLNNTKQWVFTQMDMAQEKVRGMAQFDIHAKQVCLYESMLHSSYTLERFGLESLKNSDKMKKTLQVYLKKNPKNYEGWVVARRIEDELNMTSWSLSTSFSHSANQTGRMMLYGFGDPTNGHGGLSYVKKPLKARGEKETQFQAEKRPTIMGTDQDLRKLHVNQIKQILNKLGVPVLDSRVICGQSDQLAKLKRWKMIEKIKHLLKQQSNYESEAFEAVEFRNRIEQLNEEERHQLEVIKNFAKNQRQTTKMQKDQYQKELNNQLQLQIYNLSLTCSGNTVQEFAEIKQMRKRKQLQNDDKLKDLEFTDNELKKNVISTYENYMLNLQAYIEKERKIWLEKKRKKNLL